MESYVFELTAALSRLNVGTNIMSSYLDTDKGQVIQARKFRGE